VHPKEGEARIRDRVDQALDKAPAIRAQGVILTAEGNDPRLVGSAHHAGQPVGLQPGAHDDVVEVLYIALPVPDCSHDDTRGSLPETHDLFTGQNLTASGDDEFGEPAGDSGEVCDRGGRRMQPCHATDVRLDFAKLRRAYPTYSRNTVDASSILDVNQPFCLAMIKGDKDLANLGIGDLLLLAERFE